MNEDKVNQVMKYGVETLGNESSVTKENWKMQLSRRSCSLSLNLFNRTANERIKLISFTELRSTDHLTVCVSSLE